jgi:hypothetical protein
MPFHFQHHHGALVTLLHMHKQPGNWKKERGGGQYLVLKPLFAALAHAVGMTTLKVSADAPAASRRPQENALGCALTQTGKIHARAMGLNRCTRARCGSRVGIHGP